jgi:hypothetical protein
VAYVRRLLILLELLDNYNIPDDPTANNNVTRAQTKMILRAGLYFASGLCSTDLKNDYCMPIIQAQNPAPGSTPCQLLSTVKAGAGCCFPTLLEFVTNLCLMKTLSGPDNCTTNVANMNFVINTCTAPAVVLGPTCAQIKFRNVVKLIITGLADAWWANVANHAILLAILQKIVSFNGGVDAATVDATVAAGTGRRLLQGGTVIVNAEVEVGSSGQNSAFTNTMKMDAVLETLNLNQDAQSNGLGTISVTSGGVTNIAVQSSATHVVSGFVSLAVVVACLLL